MEDCVVLLGTTILYLLRSLISLPSITEGELIGSFITQVISHLLLVLLLPVYVNLVKELLSYRSLPSGSRRRFSESECKGTTFFRTGKIFQGLILEKHAFSWFG